MVSNTATMDDFSGLSTASASSENSGLIGKIKRAGRVFVDSLPFVNLRTNNEQVNRAYQYIASNGNIDGNKVWEAEHNLHLSRGSRKALEARVENEFGITRDQIRSNLQYSNLEGGWGKFQGVFNKALDATRLSNIVGNLEIYKNQDTGRGLDFSRNTYISPEGSAVITGLLVAGPALATTSASLGASIAGYAKFSGISGVANSFSDGLQRSQNHIAQNLGSYLGVASLGVLAGMSGNYLMAGRALGGAAQLGLAKKGYSRSAAIVGLGGLGLSVAGIAMYALPAFAQSSGPGSVSGDTNEQTPESYRLTPRPTIEHGSTFQTGPTIFNGITAGVLEGTTVQPSPAPGPAVQDPAQTGVAAPAPAESAPALQAHAASTDLASTYAKHFDNKDIVWHNYGTEHSERNELRLLASNGKFMISPEFDFNDVNDHSNPHFDLKGHSQSDYPGKQVQMSDIVLRVHADLNGNGKIEPTEWGVGTFGKDGALAHLYDASGKEVGSDIVSSLVKGDRMNTARINFAQLDYLDNSGKLHSFATALDHYKHASGPAAAPVPAEKPVTPGPATAAPAPLASGVEVRHTFNTPFTLKGSYDLHDGDGHRVPVVNDWTRIGFDVSEEYGHITNFYNQEGEPVAVRGGALNPWRHVIYGDHSHDVYKEVKHPEKFLVDTDGDGKGDTVVDKRHGIAKNYRAGGARIEEEQQIIMRHQDNTHIRPNGQPAHWYHPRQAEVFTHGADPNIRYSDTHVYQQIGAEIKEVGRDITVYRVDPNADKARIEGALAGIVGTAAVYEMLPAKVAHDVVRVPGNGVTGGQSGSPGINGAQ